ncbi:MAG: serine peptidase, partial [Rubrivivax sp.]|nr:serine peptidase [Rubrivivax sp.]
MSVHSLSIAPARAAQALLASLLLAAAALSPLAVRAQTVQLPDFTELVERVGPAVVNIRTT